jgi:hypothetical protein
MKNMGNKSFADIETEKTHYKCNFDVFKNLG